MGIIFRVLGFLVGGGLSFAGAMIWMLSNDGIGSEASMKVFGGGFMLIGGFLLVAALLPRSRQRQASTHDPSDLASP